MICIFLECCLLNSMKYFGRKIIRTKSHIFSHSVMPLAFFFKTLFIYFQREEKGGIEGEKHWCMRETSIHCASHMPPTGDLARNPGMCPDRELNLLLFGLQGGGAQSTEPHQPGHRQLLKVNRYLCDFI